MPNHEAQTQLPEMWINRFGRHVNLHSDKGTEFTSEIYRQIRQVVNTDRTSTTSFHPEGNGMMGRTNTKLEQGLSKYVKEHQLELKSYLQLIMMASRSCVHVVINYSTS